MLHIYIYIYDISRLRVKPPHNIHTVHKQHGKICVSTDLISIIREFLKLKAFEHVQILVRTVRHIVTYVRATPLGRMDRARVSGQLAGVGRFTCGEIDSGIRYIGEFGCGEEPVLLLSNFSLLSCSCEIFTYPGI